MPTLKWSNPPSWQLIYKTCSSRNCPVLYIKPYPYQILVTNDRHIQHSKYAYQRSYVKIPCNSDARNKAILARSSESDKFQPEAPLPAKPSSPAWRNWMLGVILTVILPSFGHKLGPLLALKSKVDVTIETVESVTKVVEELAEEVEKVADELGEKLPEDTKLKEAMETVENLAKEAVKEAELAEDLIHKVREVEKEVERSLMEPHLHQENEETPKTSKDS